MKSASRKHCQATNSIWRTVDENKSIAQFSSPFDKNAKIETSLDSPIIKSSPRPAKSKSLSLKSMEKARERRPHVPYSQNTAKHPVCLRLSTCLEKYHVTSFVGGGTRIFFTLAVQLCFVQKCSMIECFNIDLSEQEGQYSNIHIFSYVFYTFFCYF